MRDYAIFSPRFWTGDTGKLLRRLGRDHQVVAAYLFTCASSNMIGLYLLNIPGLCHELGNMTVEGALEVLRCLSEGGYAHYDPVSEYVFVVNMAREQIGERLKPGDKRRSVIVRLLEQARKTPFFKDFMDLYGEAYDLHREPSLKPHVRPLHAPSKGDASFASGSGTGTGSRTGSGDPSLTLPSKAEEPLRNPPENPPDNPQGGDNASRARDDGEGLLQELQADYPKGIYRQGNWILGEREAMARLEEGETRQVLRDGCRRYRLQCEARGIVGTQYVMGPDKFFARGRAGVPPPYLDPFPLPAERLTATEELLANMDRNPVDPNEGHRVFDHEPDAEPARRLAGE